MSLSFRRAAGLCAVAVGAGLLGGCTSPYRFVKVSGKVLTCEGKPAAGGTIVFQPTDDAGKTGRPAGQPGRASRGVVGPDGSFTLTADLVKGEATEGVLVGPHRVTYTMPPTERPILSGADKTKLAEWKGPEYVKGIEDEYARMVIYPQPPCSTTVSPDQVEVPPAGGTFEFKLQPK